MSAEPSEQLKNVLRATVAQVEQESGVSSDDPALVALKRIVLQRIADLELAQAVDPIQSPEATDSVVIPPGSELQDAKGEAVIEDPQFDGNKLA